jgi:hypothetical protein
VVLAISDDAPGTREAIVHPDDKVESVGVREDKTVFEVYRATPGLQCPALFHEAVEKSERSVRNEQKRIEKKFSLFASSLQSGRFQPRSSSRIAVHVKLTPYLLHHAFPNW